jgi:hypothetical protein
MCVWYFAVREKDPFGAASRPMEAALSYEMDGKDVYKSKIPSFYYLVSLKMDGKRLFPGNFPYI